MEKSLIDRRVVQMEGEGVVFHYNSPVGGQLRARSIRNSC